MNTLNIIISGGTTKRLPTAGKYCDMDIIITAKGGGGNEACDKPHVFHVEGVENLPQDAMNGSLAAVTEEIKGTKWVLNDELTPLAKSELAITFASNEGKNSDGGYINYDGLIYTTIGPPVYCLRYRNGDDSTMEYVFKQDNMYGIQAGWNDEIAKTIVVISAGEAQTWLDENGTNTGEIIALVETTTLYSRVNGEWISEEDENFAVVFDCPGDCVIVVDELPTQNIDESAIYLCDGEYYRYIDGEWKQYVIEGEESGGEDCKYEIFGSHAIAPADMEFYIVPEKNVTIDCSGRDVYAYFTDETGETFCDSVRCIEFRSDGEIYVECDSSNEYVEYRLIYDAVEWYAEVVDMGKYITFAFEQTNRVVEFLSPVKVTQEEYALLKGLFTTEDRSVYDIGYEVGYSKNQEILSELMEWTVTTWSTDCTVVVQNKHWSKYLHAVIERRSENNDGDIVDSNIQSNLVPPNTTKTFKLDSPSGKALWWRVDIKNVRFTENGT